MPLETFFDHYRPGPDLAMQVSGEQNRLRHYDTPFMYLTDTFIGVAQDELRQKSTSIIEEFKLDMTPETGNIVFDYTQEQLAAITFGVMIKGFVETESQGFFDHKVFRTRLNNAQAGTLIQDYEKPDWMEEDIEILTPEQMANLRQLVASDRSYASVIENPDLWPPNLKRYLGSFGLLNFEPFTELPKKWREVASSLLSSQTRSLTVSSSTKTELDSKAKNEIEDLLKDLDF